MGWREEAKCRNTDPDFFFPLENQYAQIRTAKAFCLGCSVRMDCLTYAIGVNASGGIFGGATEKERKLMGAFLIVANLPQAEEEVQDSSNEYPSNDLLHTLSQKSEYEIHIVLDTSISIPVEYQYESTQPVVLVLEVPQEYRTPHLSQSGDFQAECG